MEHYLNFLRPRTPDATLSDVFSGYKPPDQRGHVEAISTLSSAHLDANVTQEPKSENVVSAHSDSYLSFLRPRTPEVTFFGDTANVNSTSSVQQSGDGVLTRRQAHQLAQNQLTDQSNQLEAQVNSDGGANYSSEVPSKSENHELPLPPDDNSWGPFHRETLVAENDSIKAYAIKTNFRKMKNFM